MTHSRYDAIVVGARCAGSPVAMLLARRGHRVLLVDRARFPSDTISTHLVHPPGVAALRRWGLLDRVVATGCPAIHTYAFDFGPFALAGTPGDGDDALAYAPRRTVLDDLLLAAAAEAGAEVRLGFVVEELLVEDGRVTGIVGRDEGGARVAERAAFVVGADGVRSLVARQVGAPAYHEHEPLQASYYAYWSGLPMDGRFEGYDRGDRAFAAWPTNDGLTVAIVSWPYAQFDERRGDVERSFHEAIGRAPALAARLAAGRREERFVGFAVPGFFRRPYGPGWALVGDAAYTKDFITAQGITDAFRSAESCAQAIDGALSGSRPFEEAMAAEQARRDERVMPLYEFTRQFAQVAPAPPEMQRLLAAVHGNRAAMDGFVRVFSGVVSPADFFSEEHVGRIFAAAAPSPPPPV